MKIMFFIYKIASGGTEQMLINCYKDSEIIKKNKCYLVSTGINDMNCYEKLEKCGFKIIITKNNILNKFQYFKEIRKLIKDNKIDVVYSNLALDSYIPLLAAKINRTKVRIAHMHTTIEKVKPGLINKFKRFVEIFMINELANQRVACSKKSGISYFYRKFKVIYNGVYINEFKFNNTIRMKYREKYAVKHDEILIGYFARFEQIKNHFFLLDTFNDLLKINEKYKLFLIGTGTLEEEIMQYIKSKNMEKKIIIETPKNNISDYYQMIDICAFPSLSEGFGLVAVEAQLNGIKCICSNNIPKETKISDNIVYLELIKEKWKQEFLNDYTRNFKNIDKDKFNISKQKDEISILFNTIQNKYNI